MPSEIDRALKGIIDQIGNASSRIRQLERNWFASVKVKDTTGDPAEGHSGDVCINTADGTIKMFANGQWQVLDYGNGETPSPPMFVAAMVTFAGYRISWSPPTVTTNIKEYVIFSDDNVFGSSKTELSRVAGNTVDITYQQAAGDTFFWVASVGFGGAFSQLVETGQVFSNIDGVANNSFFVVAAEFGGYTANWQAVDYATGYEAQSATDITGTGAETVWTGNTTSMPLIKKIGMTHFRVRAIAANGELSAWNDWKTDDVPPPAPVVNIKIVNESSISIDIDVTDTSHTSPGFSHYRIRRADDAFGSVNVITVGEPVSFEQFPYIISQGAGSTYYYEITPFDWAGNTNLNTGWLVGSTMIALRTAMQDMFDGYGLKSSTDIESLYWMILSNNDFTSGWFNRVQFVGDSPLDFNYWSSTYAIEGQYALKVAFAVDFGKVIVHPFSPSLDMSVNNRFTDNDYVVFSFYVESALVDSLGTDELRILFSTVAGSSGYIYSIYGPLSVGRYFYKIKKSDFTPYGTGYNWNSIAELALIGFWNSGGSQPIIHLDDFRLVKADPDIPTVYNDTGAFWNFSANTGSDFGEWHVYQGNRDNEPAKPYSMGQIKSIATPADWYLAYKPLNSLYISNGTIQCGVMNSKISSDECGVAFFVKDVTPDSWDMYALEIFYAISYQWIRLVKWVGGVKSTLGTYRLSTWTLLPWWIGADFKEYTTDGGRIKVYASRQEGNVVQAVNLVMSVQDSTWISNPGGSVGLLSKQANVRFINIVAGSPAHAEVADVARALDGPIIVGETKRVRVNPNTLLLESSTDGVTWNSLDLARVSKLRESDDGADAWQTDAAGNLLGNGTRDIYPASKTQGLNTRFERLFGADVPANSYGYTFRGFRTNDFPNHIAGFEDSQASPYSFGGSPGGFSTTAPANTSVASSDRAHWLKIRNDTSASPAYVQWSDATGKNNCFPIAIISPLSMATDVLVAEWRFWDTTSPVANSRWWALRFNWLGTTMPQFPLRAGLWYSAAVGDGLTFTPTTGTLVQLQSPISPGQVYSCYMIMAAGPSCFANMRVAEGLDAFNISATTASMPAIIRCARFMTFQSYQAQWLDELRFT